MNTQPVILHEVDRLPPIFHGGIWDLTLFKTSKPFTKNKININFNKE